VARSTEQITDLLLEAHALLQAKDPINTADCMADLFPALVRELGELREDRDHTRSQLEASQDQLVQSGKMAAVGQLAAGVAHEVNNPLQIILSRVQLLMMRHKVEDGLVKDLRLVESNVKRISRIIRSLLDFARHNSGDEESREIDLVYLVNQTINLMHHLLEKGNVVARIHADDERSIRILGNVGEIEQVFLNLLINALQAMDGGGTIDLHLESDGETVRVRFEDSGEGISRENLPRIFEPFFTTREAQGGTGLGLSIIFGIIEKHGAHIEVDSEIAQGTTFSLRFKAAPEIMPGGPPLAGN
jgi:two-component system NtrC family sensor kinase